MLAREIMEAFCKNKIRDVSSGKRLHPQVGFATKRKRMNAFSLFVQQFDQNEVSKETIKNQWVLLDNKSKKKLKREARMLNNANEIATEGGKPKVKRNVSGYQVYTKELMAQKVKMVDVATRWHTLTEAEKQEYKDRAEKTNRERKTSENQGS